MLNKKRSKLGLHRETLRRLDATTLAQAAGGTFVIVAPSRNTCFCLPTRGPLPPAPPPTNETYSYCCFGTSI